MRNARTADAGARRDPHDGPVATTAPVPTRTSAEDAIPSLVARAAVCTVLLGLALGIWCRSFSEGSGGLVGIGLAQLGAPWVLVAFAAGVLVAEHGRPIPPSSGPPSPWAGWRVPARWSSRRSATTATPRPPRPCSGRPSGCWSAGRRVSPAPRGGPDPVRSWRPWQPERSASPSSPRGSAASTSAGSTPPARLSHLGARWLVAAGLALPVLLTRGRPAGVVASISVVLLAAPVAALVVVASHGLGLA